MRYNTGNPVEPDGSIDPRDLYDNAAIADLLLNGPIGEYLSRLGVPLKSWQGIMKQVTDYLLAQGYESVFLAYGAGVVVQRQTQLVQRAGELYRVVNASDAPLTLTGTWATDSLKLQAVGDSALRAALASSTGTAYIGRGTQTLEQSLLQQESLIAEVSARAETGVFGDAVMRTRVRSNISANPAIYILGDSISHGAFALDSYRNSWPNILKRCINLDYGSISYGFVPLMTMGSGATLTQDIHEILLSPAGAWQAREASTGSYVPQGLSWVSTAVGSILSSTIPTFQNRAYVWYIGNPSGGTFDIKINGTVVASVNTAAASVTPINVQVVALTADKSGATKIECVTTSANKVELCGFSYVGPTNTLMVQNFSNSGRRLRWVDESVIKATLNGTAMMIMALGYNDSGQNLTDPAYFAEFKQRIDWFIYYANLYETPIVVPDFCWLSGPQDPTRLELQRLAKETKGVYIPFPDMFKKTEGPASDLYRRDTLKLFTDGAHPNIQGHKYIAETIAKRIGLSCTSKKQALDFYDWWYPLKIADTGITALGQTADTVSAVKNNGSQYMLRLNLAGLGVATNQAKLVQQEWPSRAGILNSFASVHSLAPKTDGTPQGSVTVAAGGNITANPNAQNAATTNFVFVSAPVADKGAI